MNGKTVEMSVFEPSVMSTPIVDRRNYYHQQQQHHEQHLANGQQFSYSQYNQMQENTNVGFEISYQEVYVSSSAIPFKINNNQSQSKARKFVSSKNKKPVLSVS